MRITLIALFVLKIRSSLHLRFTLKDWKDLFGESDNDHDDEFDGFFEILLTIINKNKTQQYWLSFRKFSSATFCCDRCIWLITIYRVGLYANFYKFTVLRLFF